MSPSDSPNLERLKRWAEPRGMVVQASSGTQREPDNVVALTNGGVFGDGTLLSRSSMDSIDTAAMYVLNTLNRLGVTLEPVE